MTIYYIPVSGYYQNDKVFLVGPFNKKRAQEWMEQVLTDPRIDRHGHPRDFDNLFVIEPVSKTFAKRRFAVTLREGRVISAETEPTFDSLQQAIELQTEYIDAIR